MIKKSIIDGIVYEEINPDNYIIRPENGLFKDDFDKEYYINVVREEDGSWRSGLQYSDEYVPEKLPDYINAIKKRIHFKGRGKTVKPTCPQCGEDMYNSYIRKRVDGKLKLIKTGIECPECKCKDFD
jgi:ssDNA-binding Zn-finger/Zn-ribbon topoisomerase 1